MAHLGEFLVGVLDVGDVAALGEGADDDVEGLPEGIAHHVVEVVGGAAGTIDEVRVADTGEDSPAVGAGTGVLGGRRTSDTSELVDLGLMEGRARTRGLRLLFWVRHRGVRVNWRMVEGCRPARDRRCAAGIRDPPETS